MKEQFKKENLINLLYDNLKAVQVVFRHPNGNTGRAYTYKTFDDYKIGDRCIVDSPREGYVVVEVVGTDESKIQEGYRLKWVVQKVVDSGYKTLIQKEDDAIKKLNDIIMKSKRKKLINEIEEIFFWWM